jgi:hypothetical protein
MSKDKGLGFRIWFSGCRVYDFRVETRYTKVQR